MTDPSYRRLVLRSLVALLVCGALVTACYFFVDKPVAFFVQRHQLPRHEWLKWLTYPPPYCLAGAPLVLVGLAVARAWRPWTRWQRAVCAAALNIIVAEQTRQTVKVFFGRYWPATWIDDNPSLLQNDAYGFHPFHTGSAYASFPSGHTAMTVSLVAILWIAYPRWRWLAVVLTMAVVTGLVGMNYHFVGDTVAGGFLGAILGAHLAHYFGLAGER